MQTAAFLENVTFNDDRVVITPMIDTSAFKEIRITFKTGQTMKEHKTAYPITVMVLEGRIDFEVSGQGSIMLGRGEMIALDAHVVHALTAIENSIVRLTLNKQDSVQRVNAVLNL